MRLTTSTSHVYRVVRILVHVLLRHAVRDLVDWEAYGARRRPVHVTWLLGVPVPALVGGGHRREG